MAKRPVHHQIEIDASRVYIDSSCIIMQFIHVIRCLSVHMHREIKKRWLKSGRFYCIEREVKSSEIIDGNKMTHSMHNAKYAQQIKSIKVRIGYKDNITWTLHIFSSSQAIFNSTLFFVLIFVCWLWTIELRVVVVRVRINCMGFRCMFLIFKPKCGSFDFNLVDYGYSPRPKWYLWIHIK